MSGVLIHDGRRIAAGQRDAAGICGRMHPDRVIMGGMLLDDWLDFVVPTAGLSGRRTVHPNNA